MNSNVVGNLKAFGPEEWKEYLGVDAGKAPPMPEKAYGEEEGDYMLTFIPEKIKVIKDNGDIEEVCLDNLEIIGELAAHPKKGYPISFSNNSWQVAILEKRKEEKPHWVKIKKEVKGRNLIKDHQQNLAECLNVQVSGLIDTVISVFMNFIRSGERNFIFDSRKNEYNCVQVEDSSQGLDLCIGFEPSGVGIFSNYPNSAHVSLGFAPSKKSY